MMQLSMGDVNGQVEALLARFDELPNHIARKHAQAAVQRVMKFAIPVLKKNTPKRKSFVRFGGGRNGREYTAEKVRGGTLRASVIAKSEYKRAKGGGPATVYGVVGYSTKQAPGGYGITQSRKAIWLEFGTEYAFARGMVQMTLRQIGNPSAEKIAQELAFALEKAAKELESKKNPGMSKRGLAAGVTPR